MRKLFIIIIWLISLVLTSVYFYENPELIEINKNKALYIPIKNRGITLDFDTKEDFTPL